jgi:hypothetical protein
MERRINRRQALAGMGSVSLGALLAACGSDGAQVTDADGIVEFVTVYPGWYQGRTVHVHAKVHIDNSTVLTTQLFFDEDVTDAVYAKEPYTSAGGRDTRNVDDTIFDDNLVLTLSEDGEGWLALITVDVAG